MRQIVLDTETTGLEAQDGHRIIEVGCIELLNRRLTPSRFHYYLNPERDIDEGAMEVHGLTKAFLADKPRFAEIAQDLLAYVRGAELIIHNAPFDRGFLDAEFSRVFQDWPGLAQHCSVLDTLQLARQLHPGQKNNLDALCKRYHVDNTQRTLHGALLDAEILADVYLAMTGGQAKLSLESDDAGEVKNDTVIKPISKQRPGLRVIQPNMDELAAHQQRLQAIHKSAGQTSVWERLEAEGKL
jgi:DNA polymerase-3 subunit epsilon